MLRLLFLLALLTATAFAQTSPGIQSYTTNIVSTGASVSLSSTGIAFHKLSWTTSGTVSTCTTSLDTSTDGISWSVGGAVTAQTCTSPGSSTTTNVSTNFLRINITVISGGGFVTVTWNGWVTSPTSGGSNTANNGQVGAVATYAAAGGSTTIGPDANLTSNGTGTFTIGAAGSGIGVLKIAGSTSGTPTVATCSAICNTIQSGTAWQYTAVSPISLTAGPLTTTLATGTAPFTVTSTTPVSNLTTVPTTYNHSGVQQVNAHLVVDSGTLVGGTLTVTFTGSATFTSSASYACTTDDSTALNPLDITYTSGSVVVFNGTTTDTFRYICAGN